MIVTLSRQLGSGGDVIAARVAAAIGMQLVDREHIYHAALAVGVPEDALHKLMYAGTRTLAGEIFDSLKTMPSGFGGGSAPPQSPLGGVFAPMLMPASVSLEEGARTVGLVIKDVASQDNVVILGQGGQIWLRDYQGACHVQIVAPLALRVARIAERHAISPAEARRQVRRSDLDRGNYLARHHNVNWLDPLLYHLVINTGQTPVDAAVSLVMQVAQVVRYLP